MNVVVAVPSRTRLRAITLAAVTALAACGDRGVAGMSVAPVAETCVDLGATEAVGLSWSQTGRYLAIGTFRDGETTARVIDSEGRVVVEPIVDRDMLSASVVATPDGRLAWIERRDARDVLVERSVGGEVATEVPDDIFAMRWTAIGFALLQLPFPEGGTRILNLDVDRPDAPTVSYETELQAEHLWMSADPETTLLTIVDIEQLPPPISFLVVGADTEQRLEPPGGDADTTGASMPSLRQWVVYHAPATFRMMAIRVADPSQTVVLVDRDAARGAISDQGILAYVPVEPYGRLCLVDVSAKLR